MQAVKHFYRKMSADFEYCFNVEISSPLTTEESRILQWLLAETFETENFAEKSFFNSDNDVVEIGPRLNFETAYSTNAVAICHACGLKKVGRVECSRRYLLPKGIDKASFIAQNHDRMTECLYPEPIKSFTTRTLPEKTYTVPLSAGGLNEFRKFNRENGLGMDEWDMEYYTNLFVKILRRDPTNVELFMLGNNNSEHARHWFFKGKLIIDGSEVSDTILQIIKSPLIANQANSVIAFSDNSSAIQGYKIWTVIPQGPGVCSPFVPKSCTYHIVFTAETHNYPSGVQPFQGATTGTGGRIRDVQATGRGALVIAGTAGYCTAALHIPDYNIPGEPVGLAYPFELSPPLEILVQASNGASDYGNKFGEPIIQGFIRTFEQVLPNGERRGWIKPIMFTGGVGQIDELHITKEEPRKEMLIVQVGGPAYRIGMGGGSASSMIQGENIAELDFNAVQRGNAEMENKLNRVIRTCVEMGNSNPLLTAHDQGAGGPANVLSEIINSAGGVIKIRNIKLGDPSMAVVEIWCAEYQERCAFLVHADRNNELLEICQREKVNCEVLGEITGDGRIVVYDDADCSHPVNLPLNKILGEMPQKTFVSQRSHKTLKPLQLPSKLTIIEALQLIFRLPSVGSKGFLVRKVDRSVTGLIAQQQCCGPLQLPVSDVAIVTQSHFGLTGVALAIGEQPIKILVNERAGARMAVGEMLTNMVSAKISDLSHIKCSVNWMWAAKLPGEGSTIYNAAVAIGELMTKLGIAADGGKDSISMAAMVGTESVKAPGEVVISGYATMPDISKKATPDVKKPGQSKLAFIDLGEGKNRLGGSALAQAFSQTGDDSPDVDNPALLINAFKSVQRMVDKGLILACHDRSDGGLITTLTEMAISGNCGMLIKLSDEEEAIPLLFSEELGVVLEYLPSNESTIRGILEEYSVSFLVLGHTTKGERVIISHRDKIVFDVDTPTLISWWEATSDRLEAEQMNPVVAGEQARHHKRPGLRYDLTFQPEATSLQSILQTNKPKVAIIREEGSNGDREMTSAFFWAGFEPWDVTMTDLLEERISLNQFRGIVFVGGFSYADVLDPAKGWAGIIRFNSKLRKAFDDFFNRQDTFSLGVCNGCQLMAFLGIVPWQGIDEREQPRFIQNHSQRFESHWGTVRISESPSIMLKDMGGSILGIWSAHGGGRLFCPNEKILHNARQQHLTPIAYVDDKGKPTEEYRFNPNGSPLGITAFCSPDGRHLAMMPHPERSFLLWQWPWVPEKWKSSKWKFQVGDYLLWASPWLMLFQNAREWCDHQDTRSRLHA
ncbi:MAG: phosphoribosylformylglycinamidine synthase [Chloroflexi bacterium]|nr:phosphoribosylformylglycinamidine synthase [Chloroflexota bacterium]MBM4449599.1 phosphoribosylformylglycinamidine synthase [Chloroflexota bacterium]